MIASADVRVGDVSGLLLRPDGARLLYVLAHGAGAGMRHPFLESIAQGLAERSIATLRYQFLYMERRARPAAPPARGGAPRRGGGGGGPRGPPGAAGLPRGGRVWRGGDGAAAGRRR